VGERKIFLFLHIQLFYASTDVSGIFDEQIRILENKRCCHVIIVGAEQKM
jgi:hypothetical protein